MGMKSGLAGQAANPKGPRRRRFWSSDEKRRMVAESLAPGAKHASRRAIAEERRGDYIRLRQFIEPEEFRRRRSSSDRGIAISLSRLLQ
jgi:hypothetical protein